LTESTGGFLFENSAVIPRLLPKLMIRYRGAFKVVAARRRLKLRAKAEAGEIPLGAIVDELTKKLPEAV
jgi:hypothetical protein